jgi:hypothetical protein
MSRNEVIDVKDWDLLDHNSKFEGEICAQIKDRYNLSDQDTLRKFETIKKLLKVIAKEQYNKSEDKKSDFRETDRAIIDNFEIRSEIHHKKNSLDVKDSKDHPTDDAGKPVKMEDRKYVKITRNPQPQPTKAPGQGHEASSQNANNKPQDIQKGSAPNKNEYPTPSPQQKPKDQTPPPSNPPQPPKHRNSKKHKSEPAQDPPAPPQDPDIILIQKPSFLRLCKKSLDHICQIYLEIDQLTIDPDTPPKPFHKKPTPRPPKSLRFNLDLGYPEFDPKTSKHTLNAQNQAQQNQSPNDPKPCIS